MVFKNILKYVFLGLFFLYSGEVFATTPNPITTVSAPLVSSGGYFSTGSLGSVSTSALLSNSSYYGGETAGLTSDPYYESPYASFIVKNSSFTTTGGYYFSEYIGIKTSPDVIAQSGDYYPSSSSSSLNFYFYVGCLDNNPVGSVASGQNITVVSGNPASIVNSDAGLYFVRCIYVDEHDGTYSDMYGNSYSDAPMYYYLHPASGLSAINSKDQDLSVFGLYDTVHGLYLEPAGGTAKYYSRITLSSGKLTYRASFYRYASTTTPTSLDPLVSLCSGSALGMCSVSGTIVKPVVSNCSFSSFDGGFEGTFLSSDQYSVSYVPSTGTLTCSVDGGSPTVISYRSAQNGASNVNNHAVVSQYYFDQPFNLPLSNFGYSVIDPNTNLTGFCQAAASLSFFYANGRYYTFDELFPECVYPDITYADQQSGSFSHVMPCSEVSSFVAAPQVFSNLASSGTTVLDSSGCPISSYTPSNSGTTSAVSPPDQTLPSTPQQMFCRVGLNFNVPSFTSCSTTYKNESGTGNLGYETDCSVNGSDLTELAFTSSANTVFQLAPFNTSSAAISFAENSLSSYCSEVSSLLDTTTQTWLSLTVGSDYKHLIWPECYFSGVTYDQYQKKSVSIEFSGASAQSGTQNFVNQFSGYNFITETNSCGSVPNSSSSSFCAVPECSVSLSLSPNSDFIKNCSSVLSYTGKGSTAYNQLFCSVNGVQKFVDQYNFPLYGEDYKPWKLSPFCNPASDSSCLTLYNTGDLTTYCSYANYWRDNTLLKGSFNQLFPECVTSGITLAQAQAGYLTQTTSCASALTLKDLGYQILGISELSECQQSAALTLGVATDNRYKPFNDEGNSNLGQSTVNCRGISSKTSGGKDYSGDSVKCDNSFTSLTSTNSNMIGLGDNL